MTETKFPPSEDYAGLVKELREDVLQFNLKDTVYENIAKDAADALEVVLAERDRLNGVIQSYQILLETQQGMLVATQTERDALLARLAPVDDYNLEIMAAKEFIEATTDMPPRTTYTISKRSLSGARAAIAAIRPHIEAAERERCAKIAERKKKQKYYDPNSIGWEGEWEIVDEFPKDGKEIAAAIRSGK